MPARVNACLGRRFLTAATASLAALAMLSAAHADPLKDKMGRAAAGDRGATGDRGAVGDRDVTKDDGDAHEFTDPQHRFSLTIPAGWTKGDPTEDTMVLMVQAPPDGPDDTFAENVNVVVAPAPAGDDPSRLDGLVRASIDGVKQQLKAKVIGAVLHGTLDGEDARMVTMILDYNGKRVYSQQTYTLHGRNAFVITYTSSPDTADSVNDTAASIADSWHFLRQRG